MLNARGEKQWVCHINSIMDPRVKRSEKFVGIRVKIPFEPNIIHFILENSYKDDDIEITYDDCC